MKRSLVVVTAVAAATMLLGGSAEARNGSNESTKTSTLGTITAHVTAGDSSSCSTYSVAGVSHWQCTPVLIATATPVQPVSTGGHIDWYVYGTCEYRKHADGVNNDWTGWTSCGPYSRTVYDYRSWGLGGTPYGGLTQLNWGTIDNAETLFATDCVEIRTSIYVDATAADPVESAYTSARFPWSGTNVSGICEGSGTY